jgi:hypothetical protein
MKVVTGDPVIEHFASATAAAQKGNRLYANFRQPSSASPFLRIQGVSQNDAQ